MTIPTELIERMAALGAEGNLQIPPPIFLEMDGRIEAVDLPNKQLTVSFPIQTKYQNPLGYMQGGMIATAVDNAIGPLSFLVAPPSVTKTLTMSYILPVKPTAERIWVTAHYDGRTGAELRFSAEVHTAEGTTLAKAEAVHVIIRTRPRE